MNNKPEMSLFDRVEFALRDAGFDYDEAFELATKATALRATTGEGEWVMVPREPTTEMLVAANAAWFIPDPSPFDKGDEARRAVYATMLAAAPPPPLRDALADVKCVKCGQSTMHIGNICYACSHPAQPEPLRDAGAVDKGPWRWLYKGDIDGGGAYELESADFSHDARIKVSGDFADHADVERYMTWLCAKLNAHPAPAQVDEAGFHKAIAPHLTKKQQGYVMGAFRATTRPAQVDGAVRKAMIRAAVAATTEPDRTCLDHEEYVETVINAALTAAAKEGSDGK